MQQSEAQPQAPADHVPLIAVLPAMAAELELLADIAQRLPAGIDLSEWHVSVALVAAQAELVLGAANRCKHALRSYQIASTR